MIGRAVKAKIDENKELIIYEDTDELCCLVKDRNEVLDLKGADDNKIIKISENETNIPKMEKALERLLKGQSTKRIEKEIGAFSQQDKKCYQDLKGGKIIYAKEEINELKHIIDKLDNKEDQIDFMAAIQRKKRHSKFLEIIKLESQIRKQKRLVDKEFKMSEFKLTNISRKYVQLLYTWGYSAERIEHFMSLKGGYINRITQYIVQRVKRGIIIEFEKDLATISEDDIKKFKKMNLKTGINIDRKKINRIVQEYRKLKSIAGVARKLGYTQKTVKKWIS